MDPIRVYLDHKDYANITKGLRGDPQHAVDAAHYRTVHGLVGAGRLRCYFSAVHLVEAIRSSDDAYLERYSDVIDSLTEGHCLIFRDELERREVARFIASESGLPSRFEQPELAFGRGFEAFLDPSPVLSSMFEAWSEEIQRSAAEGMGPRSLNRKQRRALAARQPKSAAKRSLPRDPDADGLPAPVREKLRDPSFVKRLATGSPDTRLRLVRELTNRAMSFSSILPYYKTLMPDLGELGTVVDGSARRLMQAIHDHRGTDDFDVAHLRPRLIAAVAHELATTRLGADGGMTAEALEAALIAKELHGILYWEAALILYLNYLRTNTGSSTRALDESDLRDLFHISYAPYVDYLVTDRYFARTIAPCLSGRFPKNVVLRNVGELCAALGVS